MDKIDQVLWERELAEHLNRDADERGEFTEAEEFRRRSEFRDPAETDPAETDSAESDSAESGDPDLLTEPAELKDLDELVGLEELDRLDDTPRAELPVASQQYLVLSVVLVALAILAVGSVGWSIGYYVV